jgi:hypothetical protein
VPHVLKKRGKGEGREGGGEKGKKKGGEKKRYLENFDPTSSRTLTNVLYSFVP